MAKKNKTRKVSVYANLTNRRRSQKDSRVKKRAEYLATLPKSPIKRFFYRLHPRRVIGFWFSRRGLFFALKSIGVIIVLVVLTGLGLFAYFRKDLEAIRPETIAQRVKSNVTKYYDRNGKLLWEDKGSGDYTLVVDADDIAPCMGEATIAIEDKDFYKHGGVSLTGIMRAAISNYRGNSVQGGSTLTQQLVKQIFFRDQSSERGLSGIPRKIKEAILSIEVERMYSKDQILTLYLNESSYGGRRNGVESAAQTYFGKSAKDLKLPECALLAAIPNQPGLYDPYNIDGHEPLIARQHLVLDSMQRYGKIDQQQADDAKAVPILDEIKPLADQFKDIKAPHFVLMVRSQLEKTLGKTIVGAGGLTVTTTLDLDVQKTLEKNAKNIFNGKMTSGNCAYINCADYAGFSNIAAAIENTKTGQVIALVGSRDFSYPGFGQDNAATAFIQPASSIKPLVYAQLLQDQGPGNANYGSGTILSDVKTDFGGGYIPQNADSSFRGNITIRQALGGSRNIPAIKAMAINERNHPGSTLKTIQDMGAKSYCTQGPDRDAGLSSAIGSCGVKLVDHLNAIASLGRLGSYVPQSTILKVTNDSGQVLEEYKASSKQVISPQAAYIVDDMISDPNARLALANYNYLPELTALGVRVASKTGTSNSEINRQILAKDLWTVGFTPTLSMAVWLGNPDTSPIKSGNSLIPAMFFDYTMAEVISHYDKQGVLKKSEWLTRPSGVQQIGGELYPSYYKKSQGLERDTMIFDRVSKKRATSATPDAAKIELEVTKSKDPYSQKEVITAPNGYDAMNDDDKHSKSDVKPRVQLTVIGDKIRATYTKGSPFALDTLTLTLGGATKSVKVSGAQGSVIFDIDDFDSTGTARATISDTGMYQATASIEVN